MGNSDYKEKFADPGCIEQPVTDMDSNKLR